MKNFFQTAYNKLEKLDCNQIKKLFERLQGDTQFLLSVCNSIKQGIIVVNLDGRVKFSNKLASAMCKKNIREGHVIWDIIPNKGFALDIKNAIITQTDFNFQEYTFMYQNLEISPKIIRGALFPLVENRKQEVSSQDFTQELSTKNLFVQSARDNVITGSIICIEDISDYTSAERKRYRDKSFNSMKNITSGIAHELKNPLAAMSVHLRLLRKKTEKQTPLTDEEREKIKKYIDVIEEEMDAMNNVVSIFLNDFKIPQANLSSKNINEVIQGLCEFILPELKEAGIVLELNLNKNIPKALVSRHAISHALLNIIKNAKDALKDNNENKKKVLEIKTEYRDGKIKINILDTGSGIPKEMQKSIFDPYFTTKHSGNGIGLTIAYKIIQIHGGDIILDTSYTKGASFVIFLPPHANEQQLLS